MSKVILPRLS